MAAMLDVEQHTPMPAAINFEELFNMELFGPSTSTNLMGGSRGSSQSPGSSFSALPSSTADPTLDTSFFNFNIPDSFAKTAENSTSPSDNTTSPASSVPFDFFGTFNGGGSGSGSSPETAPSSAAFSPKSFLAIDPSLVGAPSPVMPPPDLQQHRGETEEASDDSDDENEDQLVQPVKVGGRGKASRKGTVASGGVVKRSSAVKEKDVNDDDWRPSPEEYKKMSSKEKRQLRNKISARNFRVRRKEYISTLEGDIAERDRLIDAIREELGSTKLENVALRQEVEALKQAMLEGRSSPVLPPPAPLTPTVNNAKRSTRTSLAKPNTQKDLPTSPRVSSARAFWGGSLGAGGVTPVHATLIPDFPPTQQENINPALNLRCFGGVGTTTPNPKFPLSPFQQPHLGANFDAFTDLNPFTLKTLDAYRMQLWGRMAREAGAAQAQAQTQRSTRPQSPQSGLATALRPAYFTAPLKERDTNKYTSPTLSALLSGKSVAVSSAAAAYPSPPSSPPRASQPEIQPQHAMLAGMASQTLLSKMGAAFWDAFAGRSTGTSAGGKAEWDHEKVRRVLEGKAVVRVVDVDDGLEESMRGLSLGTSQENATAGRGSTLFSRTRAAVVGKK